MLALGLATFALAACGSDDDASSSVEPAADEAIAGDGVPAEMVDADVAPATGGAASAGLPVAVSDRSIITSVGLTMTTSNVRDTAEDVRRLAVSNGGAVFSSDVTIGDEQEDGSVPGGGEIVVRVPPQDLDRLVTDLDGAGFVTRLSQDSEDVTDQLVDLDIRIRQAETGIERIEELLAQATALDDVFAIETELSTRQVELERLRASQRNTEDLVSLATLTVQLEYRAPDALAVAEPGDGIGDAFASGWDAFVGALFAIGFVLAVSAPFLLTAAVVVGLAWLLGRRWNRRAERLREERRQRADLVGAHGQTTPPPPVAAHRRPDAADADSSHEQLSDDVASPTE